MIENTDSCHFCQKAFVRQFSFAENKPNWAKLEMTPDVIDLFEKDQHAQWAIRLINDAQNNQTIASAIAQAWPFRRAKRRLNCAILNTPLQIHDCSFDATIEKRHINEDLSDDTCCSDEGCGDTFFVYRQKLQMQYEIPEDFPYMEYEEEYWEPTLSILY